MSSVIIRLCRRSWPSYAPAVSARYARHATGTTADAPAKIMNATAPLGILAGGGGLPEQIAASVTARGRGVHIIAIEGEAGPGLTRYPHTWVNWGAIGRMHSSLKMAGVRELIIVGSVTRPDPRKVRPDLGAPPGGADNRAVVRWWR